MLSVISTSPYSYIICKFITWLATKQYMAVNDHSYASTNVVFGMLTISPTEVEHPPPACPRDIDHVYLIKESLTPAFSRL
jgi:hypothetical protein